jgi:hypothetical protein
MRVVCFYNNLDPRVAASIRRWVHYPVEYIDTSASLKVYGQELDKRWTGKQDLVIIEQDKEVHAQVMPTFEACQEPWCGFTYWINPEPHCELVLGGFGCVRFSAWFQRLIPYREWGPGQQHGIDRRLYNYSLHNHGIGQHLHGHVVHHHVYEPRPVSVRAMVAASRATGLIGPTCAPPCPAPHLLPGSYDLAGG